MNEHQHEWIAIFQGFIKDGPNKIQALRCRCCRAFASVDKEYLTKKKGQWIVLDENNEHVIMRTNNG